MGSAGGRRSRCRQSLATDQRQRARQPTRTQAAVHVTVVGDGGMRAGGGRAAGVRRDHGTSISARHARSRPAPEGQESGRGDAQGRRREGVAVVVMVVESPSTVVRGVAMLLQVDRAPRPRLTPPLGQRHAHTDTQTDTQTSPLQPAVRLRAPCPSPPPRPPRRQSAPAISRAGTASRDWPQAMTPPAATATTPSSSLPRRRRCTPRGLHDCTHALLRQATLRPACRLRGLLLLPPPSSSPT